MKQLWMLVIAAALPALAWAGPVTGLQEQAPQLGAVSRLSLLMRARWSALDRL